MAAKPIEPNPSFPSKYESMKIICEEIATNTPEY